MLSVTRVYTFRDISGETRDQVMGEGYSWAPPGLSPARVEEYMRQLPGDKVRQCCSQTPDMLQSCSLQRVCKVLQ